MGHSEYHKAWAASIARSTLVLKHMLGQETIAKGAVTRASLEDIVWETKQAVMKAASAELTPQYKRFEGLDDGVSVPRAGFTYRTAEVAKRLEEAGFVRSHSEGSSEDVVLFEKGAEVVAMDVDGEWMWKDRDETRAGDSLKELAALLKQES